jgi:hypothetical protein
MFDRWDNFYLMLGSAAAGLIGLMFVVATLMTGQDAERSARGASVFTTPTVFHFGVVLVISAMTAAPGLPGRLIGTLVGAAALCGLVYVGRITPMMMKGGVMEGPHWSDIWCYGVAPGLIYLALVGVAALVFAAPSIAPYPLALLLLALLLMAIRNAWDLVTWLAPRQDNPDASTGGPPEKP